MTTEKIKQLISERYIIPPTKPIYDGIVNEDLYKKAKYKILWILKEPYDDYDENGFPVGGGQSMADGLNERPKDFTQYKTWQNIIYVSHGILNNFEKYNDMDYYYKESMFPVLRSIAFINIQKLPAFTSSFYKSIETAYNRYKDILLKQIDYCNPDIIIGGSTLYLFVKDLQLESYKKDNRDLTYYIKDSKIYIEASHPAQRSNKQEIYVDEIIEIINNCFVSK